ncbi:MAG: hypothetical protein HQL48_06600 [Gammaproteobacteria bacterium]|nr:hypothetical protein [Gammaproteobacteria bacterium]
MNKILAKLIAVQEKIDALSTRERGILAMVAVAVIFQLWDMYLVTPQMAEKKEVMAEIQKLQNESNSIEIKTAEVLLKHKEDPNDTDRQQLQQYSERIAQENSKIGNLIQGLMTPQEMVRALESTLGQQSGIEFISLKSLSSKALLLDNEEKQSSGVFKHLTQLSFRGRFADVVAYLQRIEAQPWKFNWESLSVSMELPPVALVEAEIYTLSLEEHFLGL